MRKLHFIFFFLTVFSVLSIKAQEIENYPYMVNGEVRDMCRKGNTLYVGGKFSRIYRKSGGLAYLNILNSKPDYRFPIIEGSVRVIKPDGNGGWYIGGSFTKVGDSLRSNLVHVLSDFSIDSWNPEPNGLVNDLIVENNLIYIAGSFTSVNSITRNRIACIELSTGIPNSWDPNSNNLIYTIEKVGSVIYVGGTFTNIGGQSRTYLTALDSTTGLASSWNPVIASGSVMDMISYNNNLYIGGNFSVINSMGRQYAASFDLSTGNLNSWNPSPSGGSVYSLLEHAGFIYFGGSFTALNGTARKGAACVDATLGTPTAYNPNITGEVRKMNVYGSEIMLCGEITNIAGIGTTSSFVAVTNPSTGSADPSFTTETNNGLVHTMLVEGDNVLIGGDFTTIGGFNRTDLAAIDLVSGEPTDWAPLLTNALINPVYAIASYGDTIYFGGYFTNVNGQSKNYFAGVHCTTGEVGGWRPLFNGSIDELLVHGNTLYASGNFTSIGTDSRPYFAAFNLDNQTLLPLNPGFSGSVLAMDIEDNILYVGGTFTQVGSSPRSKIASIMISDGSLTLFNPSFNDNVFTIDVKGEKVYVGGRFTSVNSTPRNRLARFNASDGSMDSWNPNADNFIMSLAVHNKSVYIAGAFTNMGGVSRLKVAAVDTITGLLLPFNPIQTTTSALKVRVYNDLLYLGINSSAVIQNRDIYGYCVFKNLPNYTNTISGKVLKDLNLNCTQEVSDISIPGVVVKAIPGPVYGISDSSGNYSLSTDLGTFEVSQIIPRKKLSIITPLCPSSPGYHQVDFLQPDEEAQDKDFYNMETDCSFLTISIASARSRACFRNNTVVNFCNEGSGASPVGEIIVEYPENITPLASNPLWTNKDQKQLTYSISSLQSGECRTINIVDSVDCNSLLLGKTQCIKASISPRNNCIVPDIGWDGSEIVLSKVCENGYAQFEIKNAGAGDMADSSGFYIYYDGVFGYTHKFKLSSMESITVNVPAEGKTIRLEANQRPYYPYSPKTNATMEGCGASASPSLGFYLSLPNDDFDSHTSYHCRIITNSWDPNDKQVVPTGVTSNHFIVPDEMLNYTIQFQNTGNDTAYTVVLVDTLDADLDIASLEMGASSHPYTFSVSGNGSAVLTWKFENINLPDSSVNLTESMGFVNFSVGQVPNNPNGTLLNNKAYIYFDYNDPIITNETSLTVNDQRPTDLDLGQNILIGNLVNKVNSPINHSDIKVYPNPSSSSINFEISDNFSGEKSLSLFDISGVKVYNQNIKNDKFILEKKNLLPGVYFYKIENKQGNFLMGKIIITK